MDMDGGVVAAASSSRKSSSSAKQKKAIDDVFNKSWSPIVKFDVLYNEADDEESKGFILIK